MPARTCVDGTQHDLDGWSGVCRTCHSQPHKEASPMIDPRDPAVVARRAAATRAAMDRIHAAYHRYNGDAAPCLRCHPE